MKKTAMVIIAGLLLAGCTTAALSPQGIEKWEADNQASIQSVQTTAELVGQAMAPATKGGSTLIVQLFSMLAAAFFGVNRAIAAYQRKRVIEEIDANPATPAVSSQVSTAASKAVVNTMKGVS